MGKPQKCDWKAVKLAYLKGEGSCRVLAERFGVTPQSVIARCAREGWKKKVSEVVRKVSEKAEAVLVDKAAAWVEKTISRSERWRSVIDESINQAAAGNEDVPAIDANAIRALVQSEVAVDGMARRSLGLPDTPPEKQAGSGLTIMIDARCMIFRKPSESDKKTVEVEVVKGG